MIQGRVTLFFGNRGSAPLTQVVTRTIPPAQADALTLKSQPIASTIPAGAQEQLLIQVECHSPFENQPTLEVDLK